MEKTVVSVIVPVYNVEKYVSKCLDSLINQTLRNIEIICINDGSTDNSLKILEEYAQKDSRIIVINQENQGVGAARNRGLEIAKGDYLGFCDPDDWVDNDFFEKLYAASDNASIDIVKGNSDIVYSNGKVKHTEEQLRISKEIENSPIPYNSFCQSWFSAIYKNQLIKDYNINFPNTKYWEDVAFLQKILFISNSFKLVSDTFYHYFKREGSLTTQKASFSKHKHLLDSTIDIAEFFNEYIDKNQNYIELYKNKVLQRSREVLKSLIATMGFEHVDYFADSIFVLFDSCQQKNSLPQNDNYLNILRQKDKKLLSEYLFKQRPKLKPIQKIFSVKNWGGYKIFTVLGIELKVPIKIFRAGV